MAGLTLNIKALGEKLDQMGWTLTYAYDPVDGSRIAVLDAYQVAGLVQDYENTIESLRVYRSSTDGPPPPLPGPSSYKKVAK